MTDVIKRSVGKPLTLGVERDGKLIHLTATPENGKGIKVDGQTLANRGYLGVDIGTATTSVGALAAPGAALSTMWQVTAPGGHRHSGQTFSPSGFAVDLPPGDELQGTPSRPPTTPAPPRAPSPSSASPTSARSRSRRGWPPS